MGKLLFAIPLTILLLLGAIFMTSLRHPSDPFQSVLIDKPAPDFTLPAIKSGQNTITLPEGFSRQDLIGKVSLVNVFASWCISCRVEHPLLMSLSQADDIPIMGLNWKDEPGDGANWLARFGNPYTLIGDDQKGRTAIDFGVTGAPETFIIDHTGHIRHKHAGPITADDWNTKFLPVIEELRSQIPAQSIRNN